MNFHCYTSFDQLPQNVSALFAQGEKSSIFLSRPWLENLITTSPEEVHDILLASVVSDDEVLALLPLVKCTNNSLRALTHRYSSFHSVLLADQGDDAVLSCLANGLRRLPFRGLLLEPVGKEDIGIRHLSQAMEAHGFACHWWFRFHNWYLRIESQSFSEYWAGRSGKLRNTVARKRRKLEREHHLEIRIYTGAEVPTAMADYHSVYRASWKAHEQYHDLLEGWVARTSQQGWSRLGVLYIDGQAAAAQLWFVLCGKANIFRLAYDENWQQYSPGSILTSALMEYVIDIDKVEEVDFLTGNEGYKQDWMSNHRARWALSCVKKEDPSGKFKAVTRAWRRLRGG